MCFLSQQEKKQRQAGPGIKLLRSDECWFQHLVASLHQREKELNFKEKVDKKHLWLVSKIGEIIGTYT